ncbi:hypothetical protein OPV22_016906 [Ensete ventricosum]|uniref:Uncharacterized protein n=1 Tax=Ensete ventricosum TaxID=4639 RepID=A0AAV8PEE3_ENSVE|nr:hypothetical protein OPV22_016906 [Ensete ventricosum]
MNNSSSLGVRILLSKYGSGYLFKSASKSTLVVGFSPSSAENPSMAEALTLLGVHQLAYLGKATDLFLYERGGFNGFGIRHRVHLMPKPWLHFGK